MLTIVGKRARTWKRRGGNTENVFEYSSFKYNDVRRQLFTINIIAPALCTLREFPPALQSLSPRSELAPSHSRILLFSGDQPLLPAYIRSRLSDRVCTPRTFPVSFLRRSVLRSLIKRPVDAIAPSLPLIPG